MRKTLCLATALGLGFGAGCGGSGNGDGGATGGTTGGSSGTGTTALASAILTETNGAAAAQAYKDHVPTTTEAARTAAFLAYSADAVETGTFPQGFVASDIVAEMTQIALEYPDFFAAGPDGGLTLVKHGGHGPRRYTCGQSCDPSASTFATDFLQALPANLPAGLEADAGALSAEVGTAAAALEQSGTAIGQAFDQAIDTDNANDVQTFIDEFIAVELTAGDIQAAAATLGITTAQTQALEDAAAVIIAGGLLSAANAAIEAAAGSYAGCVQYQATSCAATTGGTSAGTSAGTSGGTSAGTSGASTSGQASSGGGTTSSSTSGGVGTTGGSSGGSSGVFGTAYLLGPNSFPGGGNQNGLSPDGFTPMVAHDSQQNLLAGWVEATDGGCPYQLQVAFFSSASQTWSTPTFIPSLPSGTGYDCPTGSFALALSDNGDALVAWTQLIPSASALVADAYDATSGVWTGPTQLAQSTTSNIQEWIATALNAQGQGWVVYEPAPGCSSYTSTEVDAIPYQPGSGFGASVAIHGALCGSCPAVSSSFDPLGSPGLVALSDGTFVATWAESDASNLCGAPQNPVGNIVGARGTAASWGTPFYLPQYLPQSLIEMVSGGTNAVASYWVTLDAGTAPSSYGYLVVGLQSSDTNWETTQTMYVNVSQMSAALNASGAGMVTWGGTNDAGYVDQFVAPLSSTLVFGTPQDLSAACPLGPEFGNFPTSEGGTVAVNSDGGAAVSWELVASTGAEPASYIVGAAYDPATGWGPCGLISTDGGYSSNPLADYGTDPIVADLGGGQWGTLYMDYNNQAGSLYFQIGAP
jgi:hypothetical protein